MRESGDKQMSIHRSVALNNACVLYANGEVTDLTKDVVLITADLFLQWLTKPTEEAETSKKRAEDVVDFISKSAPKEAV